MWGPVDDGLRDLVTANDITADVDITLRVEAHSAADVGDGMRSAGFGRFWLRIVKHDDHALLR